MRRLLLIILTLLLTALLTEAHNFKKNLKVKESKNIEKTLTFNDGSKPGTFKIDNVFGAIHLEGYEGNAVKMSAVKTIKAKSKEKLQAAQKEVKLEISSEGNTINVLVDGPFRKKDGSINWNTMEKGYIVQYDFTVKVPRKTELSLRTIDNGGISVNGVRGDFDIHGVNGGIRMKEIFGSGNAHTVNGKVLVDFVKNPTGDCSFHTINGKIELNCRPGLSADFQFKTFNGKIYSDFPYKYLPAAPGKGKRENGRYVYKSNRFQGVRIAKGGAAIKMETLNGNIYIKEKN
ncbi:MAG: hypothetical protein GY950_12560 [bacterium]|nr:hypothetical protein [bacterium]